MPKTDYVTKPFGDRPDGPAEREAWDWLVEHGGNAGAQVVKNLAELIRKPRCPDCGAIECCYGCAADGGPGVFLLPEDAGPSAPIPGET